MELQTGVQGTRDGLLGHSLYVFVAGPPPNLHSRWRAEAAEVIACGLSSPARSFSLTM